MARSPAQLRAMFAAMRGKGPISRARTLRRAGVLSFGRGKGYRGKLLRAQGTQLLSGREVTGYRHPTVGRFDQSSFAMAMTQRKAARRLLGLKNKKR